MRDIFFIDYIQKLILLEKRIGARTGYSIFEPFSFDSKNIMEIQAAVKKMASFAGLSRYNFIVSYTALKNGTAGNIEPNEYDKEIFIEISAASRNSAESVLCVLSHELAHQYLKCIGLSMGYGPLTVYENEILTDIAAVFIGFGKLLLNGCISYSYTPDTTVTNKTGYLSLEQISSVYLLVCNMRKIPCEIYNQRLSANALSVLDSLKCNFDIFSYKPSSTIMTDEDPLSILKDLKNELMISLSVLEKELAHLENVTLYIAKNFLKESHQSIYKNFSKSRDTIDGVFDPCLKYLESAKSHASIPQTKLDLAKIMNTTDELITKIQALASAKCLSGNSTNPYSNRIIVCPIDGTILRVKTKQGLIRIKCPKCQYKFYAHIPPFFKQGMISCFPSCHFPLYGSTL